MKPIHLAEKLEIPRKPKTAAPQTVNGSHDVAVTNGVSGSLGDGVTGKRKRDATDAGLEDEQIRKRGKVAEEPPKDDDVVVLEDSTNGAIFIDDD